MDIGDNMPDKITTLDILKGKKVEVLIALRDRYYRIFGTFVEFYERNQAILLVDYAIYLDEETELKHIVTGDGKYIEVRNWFWIREV